MAKPARKDIVAALLDRHGRTYADELGIDVAKNTPSPLFRLLCAAILMSARISADLAVRGAQALADEGWTTAGKMADSTWKQRTRTLNRSGYARYDERTSSMLGDMSEYLLERWGGDLRKLRDEAEADPDRERRLLKKAKGMGDVGVDIFFREVQVAWEELRPFADRRALEAADRLGLPKDPKRLAGEVSDSDWPRFVAALVRTRLEKDYDEVLEAARG